MKEVAGAEVGEAIQEYPGESNIFGLDRPDRRNACVHESQGCVKGRDALDRQVCVQQLLEDLG